jgi:GT2 family glycosyltransferase
MIYICIPTHNRLELTIRCITSIYNQHYKNFEIIIFDDGSTDNTSIVLTKTFPTIKVIIGDGSFWWTGSINKCVEYAIKKANEDDFIYTLNNDTEVLQDTLMELIDLAKSKPNSLIGTLNVFYNDHNRIETSAFKREKYLCFSYYKPICRYGETISSNNNSLDYVFANSLSGKGVLIPVKVFKKIGLYNSKKLPQYHGDTEFTIRANRYGFDILLSLKAKLLSHVDQTGVGTIKTGSSYLQFLKSSFSIHSPYHLITLFNYNKLIHEKGFIFYFIANVVVVVFNRTKRTLFK